MRGEHSDRMVEILVRELSGNETVDTRTVGKLHRNTHLLLRMLFDELKTLDDKDKRAARLKKRWAKEATEGASKYLYETYIHIFDCGATFEDEEDREPVSDPAPVEPPPPVEVNPFLNLGAEMKNKAAVAADVPRVIEFMCGVERLVKDINWSHPTKKPLPLPLLMTDAMQLSGIKKIVIVPTICKFINGVRLDVKCRVDAEAIGKEHCARDERGFILGEKQFTQGTTKNDEESFWLRPVLYEEGRTLRYYGHVQDLSDHPEAAATFVMRNGAIVQIFDLDEWKQIELDRASALKLANQPTPQKL